MAGPLQLLGVCFLALIAAPLGALASSSSESNDDVAALLKANFANGGAKLNLLSFDHFDSPFSTHQQSHSERVSDAVHRGRQRYEHILGRQKLTAASHASSKAYISPRVYPNNGSYLMEIIIGTPPRKLVAIADTGSDIIWIACRGCDNCSRAHAFFNPRKSSTYKAINCTDPECTPDINQYECPANGTGTCPFDVLYADGSETSGTLSKDTVTFLSADNGSAAAFPGVYFGCASEEFNANFGKSDGLVGLGRGDVSLVTQLGSQINHTFAYCLVGLNKRKHKASALTLGTISGPKPPLMYTPLITNIYESFYYVNIIGISVAGEKIKFPEGTFSFDESGNGGTIVDSGTTLTYIDSDVYDSLLRKVQKLVSYPLAFSFFLGFDLCYNISGIPNPTYPTVEFNLQGGVNVILPNENVFMVVDDAREVSCLAFAPSYSFVFFDYDIPALSILGNVWQQNFYMEFDTAKNRLGIAPVIC